ncbi:MAG: hypothetical protein QOJ79_2582 [Actinomycetota bacterium]|nr:hypothetical protein [Actinomycetota bacterium]
MEALVQSRRSGARSDDTSRPAEPIGLTVLLVDDHPLWRETVRQVLERKKVASSVVEAADAEEALRIAEDVAIGVVVMDLDLPGANGVEATRRLLERSPQLRVLVLSGQGERADVVAAVHAGAAGYLLKTAGAAEIADSVRRIALGEVVFPAGLADVVLAELRGRSAPAAVARTARLDREGDVWALSTGDTVVRIRDAKGLHYLAILLTTPGREHHVSDLLLHVDGGSVASGLRAEHGDLTVSSSLGDAGPILDAQAKAAYRRRISELSEELQEAQEWSDLERAARARAELDALTDQLSAAVGLGGRDRKTGSQSERQRVRVTKAIRTVIQRITEVAPALGGHLAAAVRTGAFCAYAPPASEQLEWTVLS